MLIETADVEAPTSRVDGTPADWASLREAVRVVECELNTDCTRTCAYCPQSRGLLPTTRRLMDEEVLGHLLDDLARACFAGRFSHHLYGEPLLHPSLVGIVRWVRLRVPGAVQVLFTNGDLLTDAVYEALLDAGIALFVVTRHQTGPFPARRQQVVQSAKELSFTSRGGAVEFLLKKKRRRLAELATLPCHAPSEMVIVGADGKVLRCYEDAHRAGSLGDLRTSTLAAIWAASAQTRRDLRDGARGATGGPCAVCDNVSHTEAGRSVATEPFWTRDVEAVTVAARALRGASGMLAEKAIQG